LAIVAAALAVGGRQLYVNTWGPEAQVKSAVAKFAAVSYKKGVKQTEIDALASKALKTSDDYKLFVENTKQNSDEDKVKVKTKAIAINDTTKSAGVTGEFFIGDNKEAIPFIAKLVKEDGKWKTEVFNVQLVGDETESQ